MHRQGLPGPVVEANLVDWQAGQSGIDGLRDLVQQNSRAAAHEADLVRGASARVDVVQGLLLARPEAQGASAAAAPVNDPAPQPPPAARRASGVARLREGPLADLFRPTDARPGSA